MKMSKILVLILAFAMVFTMAAAAATTVIEDYDQYNDFPKEFEDGKIKFADGECPNNIPYSKLSNNDKASILVEIRDSADTGTPCLVIKSNANETGETQVKNDGNQWVILKFSKGKNYNTYDQLQMFLRTPTKVGSTSKNGKINVKFSVLAGGKEYPLKNGAKVLYAEQEYTVAKNTLSFEPEATGELLFNFAKESAFEGLTADALAKFEGFKLASDSIQGSRGNFNIDDVTAVIGGKLLGTGSATTEPTTEEPTTEQPTTEEPTTEQPTTEQPTTEQPTTEQPTTEQPTTEQPTTTTGNEKPAETEDSSNTTVIWGSVLVVLLLAAAAAYYFLVIKKKKA